MAICVSAVIIVLALVRFSRTWLLRVKVSMAFDGHIRSMYARAEDSRGYNDNDVNGPCILTYLNTTI